MLQKEDPCYVPPFPGSVIRIFNHKHPFHNQGKLFPFLAYKNGVPVGRIVATLYNTHNKFYNDKVGFFGFFDSINNEEVSFKLFNTAQNVLKNHGMSSMRGPYNPTVNDECGLLIEGFEKPPFIMMPHNPSYYERHYENFGLSKVTDLFAFYVSADSTPPSKLIKIVEHAKSSAGITIRDLNINNLKNEIPIIADLYNKTLKRNWGFVPISVEELEYVARDLKQIIDPRFVLFAEKDGIAVGFCMFIPNINEFLLKARSSHGLMRILKVAWYLKTRFPKELRLAVLGVLPEFRNKGVASIFYLEALMRAKGKVVGGEMSWVEENNKEIIKAIELMGGKKYKTYRIYKKEW